MVSRAVFTLLFGLSVAYGTVLPRLHHSGPPRVAVQAFLSNGCPPTSVLAPLICKFLQPSMALPNKPQLIEPMTYIPPLVVEKCDTPHLEMEIELPPPMRENKPIIIPEAPSLPPITLPKFPIPVIVEKPIPPPVPIVEPCEPAFVPELPIVIPVAPPMPPIVEAEPCLDEMVPMEPVMIPQPPELPPFVMPELPVPVAKPAVVVKPCLEDERIPVVQVPEYIQPPEVPFVIPVAPPMPPIVEAEPCLDEVVPIEPVMIPQPPELPPFVMPELPVPVTNAAVVVEPCLEDERIPVVQVPEYIQPPEVPFVIPVAPPMPPIVEAEPCLDEVVPVEPVMIPQPPELPPFIMPELPVPVAEPVMVVEPCFEDEPIPVMQVPEYIRPQNPVPAPPQLPPVRLPILPVPMEIPFQPIVSTPMIVEDPCITEEIVVPQPAPVFVPQRPRIPEPVHVAFAKPAQMPISADPCEPAFQPITHMGGLPPYFVKYPSFQQFRPMKTGEISSLPYMPMYKK